MNKFKKILFPVDLSSTSEKIVPNVQMMVEKCNAELHLLFVARVLNHYQGMYVDVVAITKFEESVVSGATKKLEEFGYEHFKQVENVETTVATGDISNQILKYIVEKEMDLIILGTHGRKGLEKIVFGSVAERISKISPIPVMLINPYRNLSDTHVL